MSNDYKSGKSNCAPQFETSKFEVSLVDRGSIDKGRERKKGKEKEKWKNGKIKLGARVINYKVLALSVHRVKGGRGGRKETVSREEKLGDMRDKRMLSTAVNALSLCTRIRIDNVVSFKGCIIISLHRMKKRGE